MPFPKGGGKAIIRNTNIRRIRDLKMLEMKITTGVSNKVIAQSFGVHVETVTAALTKIAKTELAQRFEDQLLADLVPLAMQAIKIALTNGDEQVALEILKGTNVLKKPGVVAQPLSGGDELELHIRAKRSRLPPGLSPTSPPDTAPQQHFLAVGPSLAEEIQTVVESVVGPGQLAGTSEPSAIDAIDAEIEYLGSEDGDDQ